MISFLLLKIDSESLRIPYTVLLLIVATKRCHDVTEFEYRELAAQIFEQHLGHENSTNYYDFYIVRFALTRRTRWYNSFYKYVTERD
jgi:hypothetical protein